MTDKSAFPMMELTLGPTLKLDDIKRHMAGELSLEQLFACVESTTTGEVSSPEQAALAAAICQTFGFGCEATMPVEDLIAKLENTE